MATPRPAIAPHPGYQALAVAGLSNLVGAAVVFAYLTYVARGGDDDLPIEAERALRVFVMYLIAWAVIGQVVGRRVVSPAERWRDAPHDRAILLVPRRLVLMSAAAWLGAVVVFGTLSRVLGDEWREALRLGVGIVFGGLTTCAGGYLAVERVLRPLFAQVLSRGGPVPIETLGVRPRIALAWGLGSGIPLLAIATSPLGEGEESLADLGILAAVGIVAGALLISAATRSVSDRLNGVREALARVESGDLTAEIAVDEAGEIGTLQAGVNQMVTGLRERQVLQDLFGRHVGQEVARRALEEGVHLGGETLDVSVLFIDVAGSTWLAATRPATEVVAMLNDLFGAVVRIVGEEGGWVDKFEGDAALCVFGAPDDRPDHAASALRAGRRLSAELPKLRVRHSELDVGIGISSGPAVAGNVGAESRFEYTVIGDPVNEAARLTEFAKARPGRLVASRRAVDASGPDEGGRWRSSELIVLRGRVQPTDVCVPVDELDVTRPRSMQARR